MRPSKFVEIARYYCDLFEQFSINPPVDRLDPAYRVGTSDITARYPDLNLVDLVDLHPYIRKEMKKRGLKW